MPYVEGGAPWPRPSDELNPLGFGTWPFGEEWLWEAIATSYLPLLGVLGRAPITLSLTPVLCDQLESPGAGERCLRFLTEVRAESHRRDIAAMRARGDGGLIPVLERSAARYAAAAHQLESLTGGLLAALGRHASWTSAATHALLPLLVSDAAIAVQLETGIASHRRRFGDWDGGLWLPECGYAPWLAQPVARAGVRATCIELPQGTSQVVPGPLLTEEGVVLWPLDRQVISLVWSPHGYPARGPYRDSHRLTPSHHHAWRNDGEVYDERAALRQARADAREFVARVRARVRPGGVSVCALDTELLGHWWHEGIGWLGAVLEEASRQGLTLTTLDDALERCEPGRLGPQLSAPGRLPSELSAPGRLSARDAVSPPQHAITWGEGGDLRTWSGPAVAELAWRARAAEVRMLAASRPPSRAVRELLALQASDWMFLTHRRLAGDYPRERIEAHFAALERALAGEEGMRAELRNLAPDLVPWPG